VERVAVGDGLLGCVTDVEGDGVEAVGDEGTGVEGDGVEEEEEAQREFVGPLGKDEEWFCFHAAIIQKYGTGWGIQGRAI